MNFIFLSKKKAPITMLGELRAQAKTPQIELFIGSALTKLAKAKQQIPCFTSNDWHTALWVMNILHQGRGRYDDIDSALVAKDVQGTMKKIGWPNYKSRIRKVDGADYRSRT